MPTSISRKALKIHGREQQKNELQTRISVDKYAIIHRNLETFLK